MAPPKEKPPWARRLILEKADLDTKIEALRKFTGTGEFQALPAHDVFLLGGQLHIMDEYSRILGQRIDRL